MIKLIICDQDGTLYPPKIGGARHPLIAEATQRTQQWIVENTDYAWDDIPALYDRLRREYPNPYDGFASIGLPILGRQARGEPEGIPGYHDIYDALDPISCLKRDERLADMLRQIRQAGTFTYVVTLSSAGAYGQAVQSALGLEGLIDGTYCPLDVPDAPDNSKKWAYQMLAQRHGAEPDEVLVVGDSRSNDLTPAAELGYHIMLVNDETTIYDVLERIGDQE